MSLDTIQREINNFTKYGANSEQDYLKYSALTSIANDTSNNDFKDYLTSNALPHQNGYNETITIKDHINELLEKEQKLIQKESIDEEDYEGHLYPVAMVKEWTNKIRQYNQQLDSFLASIERYDNEANKKWIAKKVQEFCSRINFALARLRYRIIKILHRIYKQTIDSQGIIEPLTKLAEGEILEAVVAFISNLINFFLKPYRLIIQFLEDFFTYTPPLVTETVGLASRVVSVPVKLLQVLLRILKEDAATVIQNISIKFQPITLDEIVSGQVEPPKYEDFQIDNETKVLNNELRRATQKYETTLQQNEQYTVMNAIKQNIEKDGKLEFIKDGQTVIITDTQSILNELNTKLKPLQNIQQQLQTDKQAMVTAQTQYEKKIK